MHMYHIIWFDHILKLKIYLDKNTKNISINNCFYIHNKKLTKIEIVRYLNNGLKYILNLRKMIFFKIHHKNLIYPIVNFKTFLKY